MSGSDEVRARALRRLPVAHSLALRLRDSGVGEELIAEVLGVDPEALGPLLVVAQAKLDAILSRST
jgi:hypothetical protein